MKRNRPPIKLNWVVVCEKITPFNRVKAAQFPSECGVEDIHRNIIDAKAGDWVVEEENGIRFVMSNDDFMSLYKRVTKI